MARMASGFLGRNYQVPTVAIFTTFITCHDKAGRSFESHYISGVIRLRQIE